MITCILYFLNIILVAEYWYLNYIDTLYFLA